MDNRPKMKVHFTRGLHIDKYYFPPGNQDVPLEDLKTKMFAKHIKAGHIVEPSQVPRKVVAPTVQERANVLLEKLHSRQVVDATPEQAEKLSGGVAGQQEGFFDQTTPVETPPVETTPVEESASTDESNKKSGKKNR